MRWILLGMLLFHGLGQAKAQEIVWAQFETKYKYQDKNKSCSHSYVESDGFYLSALVDTSGQIEQAHLQPFQWSSPDKTLKLSPSEFHLLELGVDENAQWWVRRLTLNPRMLDWVLHLGIQGLDCMPPSSVASVNPNELSFFFEPTQTTEKQAPSTPIFANGTLKNGQDFSLTLNLNQNQIDIRPHEVNHAPQN